MQSQIENIPPENRFINRELSWLAFNDRVLQEAENPSNPLLERVNFLAISANNLDEFTMVRVAGLMDNLRLKSKLLSDDGLDAAQQLEQINLRIVQIAAKQQNIWDNLHRELGENKIHILDRNQLSKKEITWLKSFFTDNILPTLTPIAIDPAHPFPFLPNLGLAQIFMLSKGKKERTVIIPFPPKIPRFVALPSLYKSKQQEIRLIKLEDIIELEFATLFPQSKKIASTLFRIVRDSDLDIEDEAEDLVRHFERAVKHRKRGRIIKVKLSSPTPEKLLTFITSQMKVKSQDAMQMQGMVGLPSLSEIYDCYRPDLKFSPYHARFPERINDHKGDYFSAIEAKDMVVHHPFESFDVVVKFLEQAAKDENVISIKQTLYRTSHDSPIVKALIAAAEAGKSVTAVVELKARFDEEANIKWARDLERAGVQVVFGFVQLKTHSKISLVTRRIVGGLRSYVHFGTGNYHPATAKVYTDLSFFTCDKQICSDVVRVFNYLTGYATPRSLKNLVIAPTNMRKNLIKLIEREIEFAKAGKPANIWAKMNSLVDPQIIDALYKASGHNVKIELIVRGICCLRPQVKGMSENIKVKSIVGRFLEHSRIYCFGNGATMPSGEALVYIGSADSMPRNFDWRVEAMLRIDNPTVHNQILNQIMLSNLKDEKNSWILKPDASYMRCKFDDKSFSAHEYFMNNPSLSGRGKAKLR